MFFWEVDVSEVISLEAEIILRKRCAVKGCSKVSLKYRILKGL